MCLEHVEQIDTVYSTGGKERQLRLEQVEQLDTVCSTGEKIEKCEQNNLKRGTCMQYKWTRNDNVVAVQVQTLR